MTSHLELFPGRAGKRASFYVIALMITAKGSHDL